uniref:Uncharacterized protein n=1 Tax=uncultured prokaryote TaxID=198431 RepID=A0A0H5Q6Z0_9ZZZZ|nr:hypothetical protein [uncultured prokaryote]
MRDNELAQTDMLRYECQTCDMAATVVATPAAALAWLDHMERHAVPSNYRVWAWTVVELDLRPDSAGG